MCGTMNIKKGKEKIISCTADGRKMKCLKQTVSSSNDENPQFHIRAIFKKMP
jgi:hypothetical protein